MSRPNIIAFACFLLIGLLSINSSAADDRTAAKALIERIHVLNLNQNESGLRSLIRRSIDPGTMSRTVMGPYWNSASPDERREFTSALLELVLARTLARLKLHRADEFKVTGSRSLAGGDILVDSTSLHSGRLTTVAWRFRRTQNGIQIIDQLVNGASIALAERSELNNQLQSNASSLSQIISRMHAEAMRDN